MVMARHPGRAVIIVCAVTAVVMMWTLRSLSLNETDSKAELKFQNLSETYMSPPVAKKHVALASTFGEYHHDVYFTVAWSVGRVSGWDNDSVRAYVKNPYQLGLYGFNEVSITRNTSPTVRLKVSLQIVYDRGVFHGKQFSYLDLAADMRRTDLFPADPGAMIDILVLGTCVFEWVLHAFHIVPQLISI
jgi:hypothetical protein